MINQSSASSLPLCFAKSRSGSEIDRSLATLFHSHHCSESPDIGVKRQNPIQQIVDLAEARVIVIATPLESKLHCSSPDNQPTNTDRHATLIDSNDDEMIRSSVVKTEDSF
jgi:hypothetical protein